MKSLRRGTHDYRGAAALGCAILLLLLLAATRASTQAATPSGEIVSAGANHTCALTPSGAVDCWGDNYFGQAADQAGPYTQVSAGV